MNSSVSYVFVVVALVALLLVLHLIDRPARKRRWHMDEPDDDGVCLVPAPDAELVEVDTAGRMLPPHEVMVHVYRWSGESIRHVATMNLIEYAAWSLGLESAPEHTAPLPAAGEGW